jgi:hypothetical protein
VFIVIYLCIHIHTHTDKDARTHAQTDAHSVYVASDDEDAAAIDVDDG